MELLNKIEEFAGTHGMFPRPGLILTAVSGGADSVCLLAALGELSGKYGFGLAAVHYNHRLRGGDSDGDEDFVARLCHARGIPLYRAGGDVLQYARDHRLGTEEAARRLRYAFFNETAEKIHADRIATAHTADDNAETVLLNLTRGTGLKGLGGIPPKRGKLIRPMLTATRREVMEFIAARSLSFVEDATNSLDIYNRNLIRHRVVPVLSEINPRFSENVAAASALLRQDEAYLTGLARDHLAVHWDGRSLDALSLAAQARPVAARVIRLAAGHGLTARHVSDVLSLCASDSPSGRLSLPGVTAYREYGRLVLGRAPGASAPGESGTFEPVSPAVGGSAEIPELGLLVFCAENSPGAGVPEKINKSFNTFLFNYDNVCGKIVIRPRKTGDKIALFGGSGTKTLKKLFIEKRIPERNRLRIPVVADEAGVLAVRGIGIDRRAFCRPGDRIIEIEFKEKPHEE